jgi:serine/threonine protein kinase
MHRFCERCERVTEDGNLWCQDKDCPAEEGFPVFVYGDYLGDLKITKLVRVWRTGALYEAQRGKMDVLLKVAHPDDECAERLKREALVLDALSPKQTGLIGVIRSFLPATRPVLPVIQPPYPNRSKRAHAEISFRGEPRVFSVLGYAKGKILSDLMLENPQIWHYQAAWIVTTLAQALRPLVRSNKCHLGISPDIVLVETDRDGNLRPMLLDLGFIVDGGEVDGQYDWSKLTEPAYTAPELLSHAPSRSIGLEADVYSLGMVLYEMLSGHPGFEAKIRRDEQVREDVTQNRKPLPVGRPELEQAGVTRVVERAIAPVGRFSNVLELSDALAAIYSSPPPERRTIPRRLYVLLAVIGVTLLGTGLVAAYLLLQVVLSGGR